MSMTDIKSSMSMLGTIYASTGAVINCLHHQATGVPIRELHCPPVWGFIGSKKYIDVDNMLYHGRVTTTPVSQSTKPSRNHKYLRNVLLLYTDVADAVNGKDCGDGDDDDEDDQYAAVSQRQ